MLIYHNPSLTKKLKEAALFPVMGISNTIYVGDDS
jgi:hypothetical protein